MAARALGVTSIVLTGLAVDADRLALASTMGLRTVSADDRDWIEQARAMLPPNGADVVFDAAGAIDSPRQLLRRGGQLIEVGWPARDLKSAELRSLFFHGVTIINSRLRTPETWRRAIALVDRATGVALHRTRQAGAQRFRRIVQQPAAGRVPQRARFPHARRGARDHRSVALRLQSPATTQQSRRIDTNRVRHA